MSMPPNDNNNSSSRSPTAVAHDGATASNNGPTVADADIAAFTSNNGNDDMLAPASTVKHRPLIPEHRSHNLGLDFVAEVTPTIRHNNQDVPVLPTYPSGDLSTRLLTNIWAPNLYGEIPFGGHNSYCPAEYMYYVRIAALTGTFQRIAHGPLATVPEYSYVPVLVFRSGFSDAIALASPNTPLREYISARRDEVDGVVVRNNPPTAIPQLSRRPLVVVVGSHPPCLAYIEGVFNARDAEDAVLSGRILSFQTHSPTMASYHGFASLDDYNIARYGRTDVAGAANMHTVDTSFFDHAQRIAQQVWDSCLSSNNVGADSSVPHSGNSANGDGNCKPAANDIADGDEASTISDLTPDVEEQQRPSGHGSGGGGETIVLLGSSSSESSVAAAQPPRHARGGARAGGGETIELLDSSSSESAAAQQLQRQPQRRSSVAVAVARQPQRRSSVAAARQPQRKSSVAPRRNLATDRDSMRLHVNRRLSESRFRIRRDAMVNTNNYRLALAFREFIDAAGDFVLTNNRVSDYHFGRMDNMLEVLEMIMNSSQTITRDNFLRVGIRYIRSFRPIFDPYFDYGEFHMPFSRGNF